MASILIVDDSATTATTYSNMLNAVGHQTAIAENGEDGITMAKTNQPDLILMDIVMPGMNGFQAIRKLTKDPETQDIPVVITSSKNQEADIVYGQRQGAVDYLIKPISENTLLDTISKALN